MTVTWERTTNPGELEVTVHYGHDTYSAMGMRSTDGVALVKWLSRQIRIMCPMCGDWCGDWGCLSGCE